MAAHHPQILSKYWVSAEGTLYPVGLGLLFLWHSSLRAGRTQSGISTNSAGTSIKWNHTRQPPAAPAARPTRVAELTTVETNQAAQVRVGRLLLHSCGVCIAHRSQVVVHHLEGTFAGFQPPVGQRKHRCGAALMEGGTVLVTRGYLWTTGWDL